MRRQTRTPRENYVEKIERLGMFFHTVDDKRYWNEAAAYEFTSEEIQTLESATNELHEMCLQAVEYVIAEGRYDLFRIPESARPVIAQAWDDDPPALYGRFDLAYDGVDEPKLLEYNADTPTSLLEAAVIQWHWLLDQEPQADQFNSMWEGLVEKWGALKDEGYFEAGIVHFGCMDAAEDLMTTAVLMDTARQSSLRVNLMKMQQIGWDHDRNCFVDQYHNPIQTLFKLYPWEWMLRDTFGPLALQHYRDVQWIEPIWKMILSNKAILAVLWDLFPDHPNLLPAYLDDAHGMDSFVRKPLLGREGANVRIVRPTETIENGGDYVDSGFLFQGYAPLPVFEGNHAVVGSWVIDSQARGIGIRESDGPITEDLARFVPHYFRQAS